MCRHAAAGVRGQVHQCKFNQALVGFGNVDYIIKGLMILLSV
jgi:hypothetical protein